MADSIIKNSPNPRQPTLNLKPERGFTLIELLIAVALTAILSTVLIATVASAFRTNAAVTSQQIALKQVQNAVDYISRDVQQAQTTTQNYTDGANVLTFIIPTSSDGTTSYTAVYSVNSTGTLTRTVGTGSQTIATNIPSNGFVVHASIVPYYVSITANVTGLRSATAARVVLLEP